MDENSVAWQEMGLPSHTGVVSACLLCRPFGAGTGTGPAAQYIGADAASNPEWLQADTPGTTYYLGSLESQKIFYNSTDGLPNNDAATPSSGVYGCGKTLNDIYVYPMSVLCFITYDAGESSLDSFLQSTVTDHHQIILASAMSQITESMTTAVCAICQVTVAHAWTIIQVITISCRNSNSSPKRSKALRETTAIERQVRRGLLGGPLYQW